MLDVALDRSLLDDIAQMEPVVIFTVTRGLMDVAEQVSEPVDFVGYFHS